MRTARFPRVSPKRALEAKYKSSARPEPDRVCGRCGGPRIHDRAFLAFLRPRWRARVLSKHAGVCTACAADLAGWWQILPQPEPTSDLTKHEYTNAPTSFDAQVRFLYLGEDAVFGHLCVIAQVEEAAEARCPSPDPDSPGWRGPEAKELVEQSRITRCVDLFDALGAGTAVPAPDLEW